MVYLLAIRVLVSLLTGCPEKIRTRFRTPDIARSAASTRRTWDSRVEHAKPAHLLVRRLRRASASLSLPRRTAATDALARARRFDAAALRRSGASTQPAIVIMGDDDSVSEMDTDDAAQQVRLRSRCPGACSHGRLLARARARRHCGTWACCYSARLTHLLWPPRPCRPSLRA